MASQRQDTLGKIKQIESSMKEIYSVIENCTLLIFRGLGCFVTSTLTTQIVLDTLN